VEALPTIASLPVSGSWNRVSKGGGSGGGGWCGRGEIEQPQTVHPLTLTVNSPSF
jgi:hypothetical protein